MGSERCQDVSLPTSLLSRYSAPMFVDLTKTETIRHADGQVSEETETYPRVQIAKV